MRCGIQAFYKTLQLQALQYNMFIRPYDESNLLEHTAVPDGMDAATAKLQGVVIYSKFLTNKVVVPDFKHRHAISSMLPLTGTSSSQSCYGSCTQF